jgi:hypothetical protein
MTPRPLLSCPLKNGLTLLCIDRSKQLAADRWYVCVDVQITIPVEKKWFSNHPVDQELFQKISRTLGKEIIFKQKKERNFIGADAKESAVRAICERVEEIGKKYMAKDDFAAKYILKVFADQQRSR